MINLAKAFQSNLNAERRYLRSRLLPYDYHEETPLGKRARDAIAEIAPWLKSLGKDLKKGDKYFEIFNEIIAIDKDYDNIEEDTIKTT